MKVCETFPYFATLHEEILYMHSNNEVLSNLLNIYAKYQYQSYWIYTVYGFDVKWQNYYELLSQK